LNVIQAFQDGGDFTELFDCVVVVITGHLSYDGAAGTADDRVPDIAVWHFNRRTGKICRVAFWAYWRFGHN